ncbi:MAG: Fic family protein [Rickettsiales bacterium]|nr:Fic family protein [Rickettsiales bacterium]
MDFSDDRLSKRLQFSGEQTEALYSTLAEIDAIKNAFRLTDKLLPQTITRLTQSVIVTSAGASNRIEGNQLTDDEVEALYRNLRIQKFKTRDEQEVAGYLEMLERVLEHYEGMPLTESLILQLHGDMLLHSDKDQRQRGNYKFGPNRVEAKDHDGKVVGVIFDPTPPHLTPKEMQELVAWQQWADGDNFKHPLLRIGNFIFEYLAIHPFQDGNGRTSRLLTNLLMLQQGYMFTGLISHEKLIEARKADYYLALNKAQSSWKSENENVYPWLSYFLSIVQQQAKDAMAIIEEDQVEHLLSEKQLALWQWIGTRTEPEFGRKDAIEGLGFPPRTVEAAIKKLLDLKKLERIGTGRATRYRLISK